MKILNALRAIQKIKASLSSLKLGTDILDNGDSIEFDGENIVSGNQVFLKSASGDYSILPDGSYLTKSNITFTVKDALVESVNTSTETTPPKTESTEPVLQAQSKVEEVEVTEVKADAAEITPTVTVDIQDLIDSSIQEALAPLYDLVNQLTSALMMCTKKSEEAETLLSKVNETVNKIAKMPAAEPIEGAVNAFAAKQTIKDEKLLKGLRILQG